MKEYQVVLTNTFLTDLLTMVSKVCEEHDLWLSSDLRIEIVAMRSGRFQATITAMLSSDESAGDS